MPEHDNPALERAERRSRLRNLLVDCASSAYGEQEERIRQAAWLLWTNAAPSSSAPDRPALEALLAAGAHESAVLLLIGPSTPFMLSRGGNGCCFASVAGPAEADETTAEGCTPALALLTAYLAALLVDRDRSGSSARDEGVAAIRLN